MANVTFTVEGVDALRKMQTLFAPAVMQKATAGGIKAASSAVPVAVAKGISAAYNIPSARIKADIRGVRFNSDQTEAVIGFSKRPPTLTQFKPTPGKRAPQRGLGRGKGWAKPTNPGTPLRAAIVRSQGRQDFRGAFLATGQNGNAIVLRRQGDKLKGVYGPSIGSIFLGQSKIGPQLKATVEQRIGEQFIKGYDRVLSAAARGYG